MRIAYLGQMADVSCETSIAKKIRMQCLHWQAAGHTVCYFATPPTPVLWSGFAPVAAELVAPAGPLPRLLYSHTLCRRIRAWQPDVIYFRYAYHQPGLPGLFADIPAVAEINSDDTTEYALTLHPLKRIYHRLTRNRILSSVAAFVPVTHELGARFAHFRKPTLVLANSIGLADFPPLPPPPAGPPRLVFMGSPGTPWHGLGRIAEIAGLLPNVIIDVLGCTEIDWHTETGATGAPPSNLHFHGHRPRASYEPLLHQATAALGTFGLFRKGMDEACPLKVREYLAFGLPVIGACQDTDIPENAEYYLRLPNSTAPLVPARDAIAAFLHSWSGRRVPRAAVAHLDLTAKEPARLDFIAKTIATFHAAHR